MCYLVKKRYILRYVCIYFIFSFIPNLFLIFIEVKKRMYVMCKECFIIIILYDLFVKCVLG